MDDKRNSLLTIGLICAVLLVLGVADLWNSDRVYSEAENRVLANLRCFCSSAVPSPTSILFCISRVRNLSVRSNCVLRG